MNNNIQAPEAKGKEFEINLLDVAIVLARHIKLIVVLPIVLAVVAYIIARQAPDVYTSDTTFMPPKQASSASSLVSSLGLPDGFPGMPGGGGVSGANDLYIAVLKSRTMRDEMVDRFKLFRVYKTKSKEAARNALSGLTSVLTTKEGLIIVKVTDTNPQRAALLANGYVDVLLKKNNELALSEASQRRLAAENEFLKAKNRLSFSESTVKKFQENTGYITVEPEIAALRTMMKNTELQLAEMSVYTTANNPDYIKTRQKLLNLQAEIGKAQGGPGYVSKAPERILDFTRKTRDLKYAESLYQLAFQQLTAARADESNTNFAIQVIDCAGVPEQRSGPNRKNIVMISAAAGLLAAVIIAFLVEAFERTKNNKESVEQLKVIKSYLRWR